MALTRPSIEIIKVDEEAQPTGNIQIGSRGLQTESASVAGPKEVVKIDYDDKAGILKLTLSNGLVLTAKGLPTYKDLPKGSKGLRGLPGEPGIDGKDGIKGKTGDGGCQGSIGAEGPAGEKGATGDVGDVGPEGDKGESGSRGPVGDSGEIGLRGPKGAPGLDGQDGKDAEVRIVVSATDPGAAAGASCIWVKI